MTKHRRSGNRYFFLYMALSLVLFFTIVSDAAELSGDQPWTHRFEIRLASHEYVEGWNRVFIPKQEAAVWICPEVGITNDDVRLARVSMMGDKFYVSFEFTEDGTQKMACLHNLTSAKSWP